MHLIEKPTPSTYSTEMSSTTFKEAPRRGGSQNISARVSNNRRGPTSNAARAAREHWASRNLPTRATTVDSEGSSSTTTIPPIAGDASDAEAETPAHEATPTAENRQGPPQTAPNTETRQEESHDGTARNVVAEAAIEGVGRSGIAEVETDTEHLQASQASAQDSGGFTPIQQSTDNEDYSAQIQEVTGQVARVLATSDSSQLNPARVSIDVLMQRIAGQRIGRSQQIVPRQQRQTGRSRSNNVIQATIAEGTRSNSDDYSSQIQDVTTRVSRLLATADSDSLAPARTAIDDLMQSVSAQRRRPRRTPQAPTSLLSASIIASGSRPQPSIRTSSEGPSSSPLPTTSPSEAQEEDECTICYEIITTYSTLRPCGHVFDYICIMVWLETLWEQQPGLIHLTCPLCRSLVSRISHTYDETRARFSTLDLATHFRDWRPEQRTRRRLRNFANARPQRDRRVESVVAGVLQLANSDSRPGLGQDGQGVTSPRVLPGTSVGDYMDDLLFDVSRSPQEIQAAIESRVARSRRALDDMRERASTDVDGSQLERIEDGVIDIVE